MPCATSPARRDAPSSTGAGAAIHRTDQAVTTPAGGSDDLTDHPARPPRAARRRHGPDGRTGPCPCATSTSPTGRPAARSSTASASTWRPAGRSASSASPAAARPSPAAPPWASLPPHFEVTAGSIEIADTDITTLTAARWTALRATPPSAPSSRTRRPTSTPRSGWAPRSPRSSRVKTGLTRREARDRTLELLRAVHLRDPELVRVQYPHELSRRHAAARPDRRRDHGAAADPHRGQRPPPRST